MTDSDTKAGNQNPGKQSGGNENFSSMEQLLDCIQRQAEQQESVSVHDILRLTGQRWYGPLLVVAGLVMMTPVIGDIPGVPVLMGATVILISTQLLLKHNRVWLPRWILQREVASDMVSKAISWARRPAGFIDRYTENRLQWLVKSAGLILIALMSCVVAAFTPLLELIPFSATLAGLAITALGVSVLVKDGALAILAIALCLMTVLAGGSLAF